MNRYRPISDFAQAFAAEYKGFMKANGVTNLQIAALLDRNDGYVSERVNGKRPLDTDDVDALASLVSGWSGRSLMIELAKRAKRVGAGGNVTHADFGVRGRADDRFMPEKMVANDEIDETEEDPY